MSSKYPGGIISKTAPTPSGAFDTSTAPGVWTLEQQAYWQKLGQWPTAGNTQNFIEDVFSTYLYTGNGTSQTITNGINLSGKGGMTWLKWREGGGNHQLQDTVRGATNLISSNTTDAQATDAQALNAFTSSGFTVGSLGATNGSGRLFCSWTFREQAKFFDVVTFVANGSTNQRVSHNLGAVPGCIIIKNISRIEQWNVYHTSLGINYNLALNTTGAAVNVANVWGSSSPTTTDFGVNGAQLVTSGDTYVAYLYANNAGGFGLNSTDNVISCGSYSGNGSTQEINLGYEPQWILLRRATGGTANWIIFDTMRGMSLTDANLLYPNASDAEAVAGSALLAPTATGFSVNVNGTWYNASGSTYIYIAIRRGPMRTPTVGTSVFNPYSYSGDGTNSKTLPSVGFVPDWSILTKTNSGSSRYVADRLRGGSKQLDTAGTGAEFTSTQYGVQIFGQSAVTLGSSDGTDGFNQSGNTFINYSFLRAPGFFDEVCYTGDGGAREINHNLTAVPELMIVKERSSTGPWNVYVAALGPTSALYLNTTGSTDTTGRWNSSNPTSALFSVSSNADVNESGQTYVNYLFATCAGVSKVGSYTGTGAAQTINCGFTTGARFVLIKRTDSTGDWNVWDSARGIIPANDPYLALNTATAQVTGTDYVDTTSVGFDITSTAPAAINASGGTYIFLAIA